MLLSPATKLGLREPPGSSHGHWEAVPLLDPATESMALTLTRRFLFWLPGEGTARMTGYEEGSEPMETSPPSPRPLPRAGLRAQCLFPDLPDFPDCSQDLGITNPCAQEESEGQRVRTRGLAPAS